MCMGPSKAAMSAEQRKYRAEDDCRTLERAEEVRSDPSRLKGAMGHAKTQVKRMTKIARVGRSRRR